MMIYINIGVTLRFTLIYLTTLCTLQVVHIYFPSFYCPPCTLHISLAIRLAH